MSIPLNANALATLAQAKAELDIPTLTTSEDDRVTGFINAASDAIEHDTNRKLIQTTYTHQLDGSGTAYLKLLEFPVTAWSSSYHAFEDNAWGFGGGTEVATADLRVYRDILLVRRTGFWDTTAPLNQQVNYQAGYPSASLPWDLQQACLEWVKWLYFNRNDRRMGVTTRTKLGENTTFSEGMPQHIDKLLNPFRRQVYVAQQLQGLVVGGT